ncbi:MAG TPA: hypothetical protein VGW33_09975 [Terriglobia bacterium]|nr:hypothetical protein [Terriglobia bacterium]
MASLNPKSKIQNPKWQAVTILILAFIATVPLRQTMDAAGGIAEAAGSPLYVSSGATARRLALGYDGLLADVYWTRVVQYYGRERLTGTGGTTGANRYELLGPLLRITTTLDPHLLIAYRFGAIFLADNPPDGAGQPQEALALLRRGIVANPDYWRLWQDLGFIYYWDLKDYDRAARAFQAGSERPGAAMWMKAMAATIAAKGGETQTSRLLWSEIYRQAGNDSIRRSALAHLAALKAQDEMNKLDALLAQYKQRTGEPAKWLRDLVAAGLLRSEPLDPSGAPYVVGTDGRAALAPASKVDMRLLK